MSLYWELIQLSLYSNWWLYPVGSILKLMNLLFLLERPRDPVRTMRCGPAQNTKHAGTPKTTSTSLLLIVSASCQPVWVLDASSSKQFCWAGFLTGASRHFFCFSRSNQPLVRPIWWAAGWLLVQPASTQSCSHPNLTSLAIFSALANAPWLETGPGSRSSLWISCSREASLSRERHQRASWGEVWAGCVQVSVFPCWVHVCLCLGKIFAHHWRIRLLLRLIFSPCLT